MKLKQLLSLLLLLSTLLGVLSLAGCGRAEGKVIICLDETNAPITVENFLQLVDAEFYDGLTMHRIIPEFMIQGGDPNADGSGGSGKTIEGEFIDNGHRNKLWHVRGVISMARGNEMDSASSQFFICHKTNASVSALDGKYAAFGWVVEGMDVVDLLAEANYTFIDNNGGVKKRHQPRIESIRRTTYGDGSDGHAYVEIVFSYKSSLVEVK